MLNGKFFTGLPPKMIDRSSTGGRNRLESHLFWPDDTQVDTAVESRSKRRNSVQLACTERPLYEKQSSVFDNDADNKKRFTKEFSQSSIQFYDNLNEDRGYSGRPMLRKSMANKKMEITEKPTNTKLELPDSINNEAYTAAKRNQSYTSKIEFYDYANDSERSQNNRNNLRKPKMDMNDKREMELNSKNSPKLQMKRDVRSLSEEKEQLKINNHDVKTMDRPTRNNINGFYDQRERLITNEENYLRSRRSVEPRINVSPKRAMQNASNIREKRYSSEGESYREPHTLPSYQQRKKSYENFEERDYGRDYENLADNTPYGRRKEKSTRMTRNNTRLYCEETNDRDFSQQYYDDEEIQSRMQDVQLKSPRKQYYTADEYYDDEPQYNYGHNEQVKTPTNHRSSRFNYTDRAVREVDLPYKNFNNNSKRNNVDNLPVTKIRNRIQQAPKATPTSPSHSDAESTVSGTKSQKHLRSSLCFNNGEIIGENDGNRSPTSSLNPTQRRNARSSATQRVSVGLPD